MSTTTTLQTQESSAKRILELVLPVVFFAFATGAATLVRIPVPGSPVPVTLQSAVVLASGLFLGATRGAVSQALYLLLGVLGLPFFAASATLVGPTGGYIVGFIFASFLCGRFAARGNALRVYALALVASLGIFIPGVLWLKIYTAQSWPLAVHMGFTPFVLGDLIKTAIAVGGYSAFRSARLAAREAARMRKNTVL